MHHAPDRACSFRTFDPLRFELDGAQREQWTGNGGG